MYLRREKSASGTRREGARHPRAPDDEFAVKRKEKVDASRDATTAFKLGVACSIGVGCSWVGGWCVSSGGSLGSLVQSGFGCSWFGLGGVWMVLKSARGLLD
jgi:hypothetical protein